ncbi:MAG: M14 family zinc carboxypeptidase, partial [Vicinamibacterales bacterium]
DQPYRTLVEMYTSIQNYSLANPRPYDDTGWTMQLMRNVTFHNVTDKALLDQPMTLMAANAKPAGGIDGTGTTLVIDHTTDNSLVSLRFRHAKVEMAAAEDDFEAGGRKFRAGSFIIANADRAALEPTLKELSLTALAVSTAPTVKTHELDVPRIGYVHSWARTQDEGWVRAAFDHFGVPYTYFSDIKVREGNLRSKYDVIVYPHVGGTPQSMVNGVSGPEPVPYEKSELTPNLGAQDQADDIRGGMGMEGLLELAKFVREGGTLLVEGSTSTIFPEYGIATGVTVENPTELFARGSIMRGVFADRKSPIAYGYDAQVPVYFNQDPVLNVDSGFGGFGGFGGGGAQIPGVGQNTTPMATRLPLSPWEPFDSAQSKPGDAPQRPERPQADEAAQFRRMARQFGIVFDEVTPRVVLRFPQNPNDMLLSGTLAGGQFLANRAQVVDAPLGKGHVVMFAIRPFWRWQTQGTYFLGFNTILNWNDLDAGKAVKTETNQQP